MVHLIPTYQRHRIGMLAPIAAALVSAVQRELSIEFALGY